MAHRCSQNWQQAISLLRRPWLCALAHNNWRWCGLSGKGPQWGPCPRRRPRAEPPAALRPPLRQRLEAKGSQQGPASSSLPQPLPAELVAERAVQPPRGEACCRPGRRGLVSDVRRGGRTPPRPPVREDPLLAAPRTMYISRAPTMWPWSSPCCGRSAAACHTCTRGQS